MPHQERVEQGGTRSWQADEEDGRLSRDWSKSGNSAGPLRSHGASKSTQILPERRPTPAPLLKMGHRAVHAGGRLERGSRIFLLVRDFCAQAMPAHRVFGRI